MSRNRAIPTAVVLVAVTALSGCASRSGIDMQVVGDGFRSIDATLESGVARIRSGGSGGGENGEQQRSRLGNRATGIAARFPTDQVPHTLMKKPVADGRLTSGFGFRLNPTGIPLPKKHNGIDYAAPAGTPVYAAGDGVIVKLYISKSYGNYIRITHDNGFETAYAHMAAFVEGLGVGSSVSRGQQIGAVGSTGRSTSSHLHFELMYNGNFIDPLLGGTDNAVALAN